MHVGARLINELVTHFEQSTKAAKAVASLSDPRDQTHAQVQIQSYFSNYMAAIDLIGDVLYLNFRSQAYGHPYEQKLISGLDKQGIGPGLAAYSYARKLRDSIVHRGLNVASAGHCEGDRWLIECPPIVVDQKRNVYPRPCTYVPDLIKACSAGMNPVLLEELEKANVFGGAAIEAYQKELCYTISDSPNVPEWVKKMREEALPQMDWEAWARGIAENRARRIRHYLTS